MQVIDNRALINDALSQSATLTGGRFDHRYWLSKVTDVNLLIISKPEVLFDLSVKVYIPIAGGQSTPGAMATAGSTGTSSAARRRWSPLPGRS